MRDLHEAWRQTADNLRAHRLRWTLTLLGIVFGVGAVIAMLGAAACGVVMAVVGPASYVLAVALAFLYAALIWLDSASLTAGTAGTADPARRGATLAIHSMLGYAGGLVGPIAVGMALDASGGMSVAGWGLGFGTVALFVVAGLALFLVLRPKGLSGDSARG